MPQEPGAVFGGLFAGCIRDEYIKDAKSVRVEAIIFLGLGVLSSIATTYLLSAAGVLL